MYIVTAKVVSVFSFVSSSIATSTMDIIEKLRNHYNTKRPHSGLGYRPPAPEAIVPMEQRPIMH